MKKTEIKEFKNKYNTKNPIKQLWLKNFQKSIFDIINKLKFNSIYEIGCGTGHQTKFIYENFIKNKNNKTIKASDIDEELIKTAKEKNSSKISFSKKDIYKLSKKDDSADLIIIMEVFEHLDNPKKAIEKIKKLDFKHLILSVPNEPLWCFLHFITGKNITRLGNTKGHINHWSQKKFIKFLKNDFNIISKKKSIPWQIVLCSKK